MFIISVCIPVGFGAGLRSRVTLPSTVVGKAVSIMAWPEYEGSTALDIELCRVEVETVGLGQPCLLQHKKDPSLQFSKDGSHSPELPRIIRLFDYSNSWDRIVLFGIR